MHYSSIAIAIHTIYPVYTQYTVYKQIRKYRYANTQICKYANTVRKYSNTQISLETAYISVNEWEWGGFAYMVWEDPPGPIYFSSHYFIFFSTKYIFFPLFPFPLFSIFKTLNYFFIPLFIFPLSYTKISKNNNNNIRQRPTTLFASAAGIFLTLACARLRISTIVNSGYSRLARTPQGGPRFFYDWHVDVVQRIVY